MFSLPFPFFPSLPRLHTGASTDCCEVLTSFKGCSSLKKKRQESEGKKKDRITNGEVRTELAGVEGGSEVEEGEEGREEVESGKMVWE